MKNRFTEVGITHYDMFMPDGTVPPKRILNEFLNLSENTSGPIAVHCKVIETYETLINLCNFI